MESRVTRRRRMERRRKMIRNRIILIALSVALLALLIWGIVSIVVPSPDEIYADAELHIEEKEYELAEECMAKIQTHEKIGQLITKLTLSKYEDAIAEGNLELANELLSSLTDYSEYDDLNYELTLLRGKKAFELSDYETAEELLNDIKKDKEASKILDEIIYIRAIEAKDSGDFETALTLLKEIPEHSDSENVKADILFKTALANLELGDYRGAYNILNSIKFYQNSVSMMEVTETESSLMLLLEEYKTHLPSPDTLQLKEIKFYDTEQGCSVLIKAESDNESGMKAVHYAFFTDLKNTKEKAYYISELMLNAPESNNERVISALINAYLRKSPSNYVFDINRLNKVLASGIEASCIK
ncbi:MAG: hypothetical protein E7564_05035 [Ruminococcaceae bacterium]|nr:hypothetical protein [Oscillospiraceae bacterium]